MLVSGTVQPRPDRLLWPVGEPSERLAIVQDQFTDLLNEFDVEKVAVLMPERDPRHKWLYEVAATRSSMETVIRLSAIRTKIPIEVLNRETVRSRLKLKGKLDLHVDAVVSPVGTYWDKGRGEAALAALATERA